MSKEIGKLEAAADSYLEKRFQAFSAMSGSQLVQPTIIENLSNACAVLDALEEIFGDKDSYDEWRSRFHRTADDLLEKRRHINWAKGEKHNREPLEEGDYDMVLVVGGAHAGRLGYYDNDEGAKAVVYLMGDDNNYALINFSCLRKATPQEAKQVVRGSGPIARILMDLPLGPDVEAIMAPPKLVR